jgi:hypothetical protein
VKQHRFVQDSHFRSCYECDLPREDPVHQNGTGEVSVLLDEMREALSALGQASARAQQAVESFHQAWEQAEKQGQARELEEA